MNPVPLFTITKTVVVRSLITDQHSPSSRILLEIFRDASCGEICAEILAELIRDFPQLVTDELLQVLTPVHQRVLDLSNCCFVSLMGLQTTLQKCTRLSTLDLSFNGSLTNTPQLLDILQVSGHNLHTISLQGCGDVDDRLVQGILTYCTRLKYLDLSCCDQITDQVFQSPDSSAQTADGADTPKPFSCKLEGVKLSGCQSISGTAIRHLVNWCGADLRRVDLTWAGNLDCSALLYLSGFRLSDAVKFAVDADEKMSSSDLENMLQLEQDLTAMLLQVQQHAPSLAESKCNLFLESTEEDVTEEGVACSGTSQLVQDKPDLDSQVCRVQQHAPSLADSKCNLFLESTEEDDVTEEGVACSGTSHLVQDTSSSNLNNAAPFKPDPDFQVCRVQQHVPSLADSKCNLFSESTEEDVTEEGLACVLTSQLRQDTPSSDVETSTPLNPDLDSQVCRISSGRGDDVREAINVEEEPKTQNGVHGVNEAHHITHHSQYDPRATQYGAHQASTEMGDNSTHGLDDLTHHNVTMNCATSKFGFQDSIVDNSTTVSQLVTCTASVALSSLSCFLASDTLSTPSSSGTDVVPPNVFSYSSIADDVQSTCPVSQHEGVSALADNYRETIESENGTRQDANVDDICIDLDSDSTMHQTPGEHFQVTAVSRSVAEGSSPVQKPSLPCSSLFEPNITSLEISDDAFHSNIFGRACLKAFVCANRNLTKLVLGWRSLDDDTLEYIARHEPGLRDLSLVDCERVTDQGILQLATYCRDLVSLDLRGVCFITDTAIVPLVARSDCKIQRLGLAESRITDLSLRMISQYCHETISALDLSWCEEVSDEGLSCVAQNCLYLKELSLRQCPTSPVSLLPMTQHCQRLTKLDIVGVDSLTDDVISVMAAKLTNLVELDLSWNLNLTDTGLLTVMSSCLSLKVAGLKGLKFITSKPFIGIITGLESWKRRQKFLNPKRMHVKKGLVSGEERLGMYKPCPAPELQELAMNHSNIPFRSLTYAPSLQSLNVEFSDKVNDEHLAQITAVCRGTLTVIDYYGQEVEPKWIYLNEEEERQVSSSSFG